MIHVVWHHSKMGKQRKVNRPKSLDELFAGYHGDYQPVEFDTGADVGLEVID